VVNLRHGALRETLDGDIDMWRVILSGVRDTFEETPWCRMGPAATCRLWRRVWRRIHAEDRKKSAKLPLDY